LVGWGLSGIYAREVAERTTPLVRQVITLGTPINLTAPGQQPCSMLRALQDKQGHLDPAVALRLRQRPPVPCTSIYSMTDNAVPWQMCLQTESLMSENVLVQASNHSQLAQHPKVLEVITHRLAQSEDAWRPFDA
ncbi:MAG: alpha/beta hydrolase, partial [Ramlibacter sp.]